MKRFLLIAILCLLTGCNTDSFTIKTDTSVYDKKIEQLGIQMDQKLEAKAKEIVTAQDTKQVKIDENLQNAAGLAYGIYYLNGKILLPNRTDSLIRFKAIELVTRLPALTPQQLIQENDDLKKDLDETLTTIAALDAKYNTSLEQAKKDKAAIDEAQITIDQKKKDLEAIKIAKQKALTELQTQRHLNDQQKINQANQNAANAEDRKALIALLIKIFVGASIASAVGAYAIRSIILVGVAAGFLGLSIFVAFVEPWIVITAGCVIGGLAILGIAVKFYETHKAKLASDDFGERVAGAVQEYKTKVGDSHFASTLAPHLSAWTNDAKGFEGQLEGKLKKLNLI